MEIHLDRSGTVHGLRQILEQASQGDHIGGLLILACDENGFVPSEVDELLQRVPIPLFGGVFPAIIHDREQLQVGTIVACLNGDCDVRVVADLSDRSVDFDQVIDGLGMQAEDARTMLVLVDGYSQCISGLIYSLFNVVGLGVNYIGGGAGSINPDALNMEQKPCLMTNQGMVKDSALLVMMDVPSGIGVSHGWTRLTGPFKVTESEGNAIKTLDWKPAFEVYKAVVDEHAGREITTANFFDVAKAYPFGLTRLESETVVRDPFTVNEDGALVVATEIPQESYVDILTGDANSLVNATQAAVARAEESFQGTPAEKTTLFIDCISRALFLGDGFCREIDVVHDPERPLIGVLSLGEIANSGDAFLELFNKTTVVGVLGD